MFHLEDKLADFIFEELEPEAMMAARRHVAECLECRNRVAEFQKVQHALEKFPDADPPRRTVFVSESREPLTRKSRLAWAIPGLATAALVLAVVLAGPFQVEWGDGAFQVTFGTVPTVAPSVAAVTPVVVDDEAIARQLQEFQQAWLDARLEENRMELERIVQSAMETETANQLELRRIRGEMAYLFDMQQMVQRGFYDQAAAVQLIAQRTGGLE